MKNNLSLPAKRSISLGSQEVTLIELLHTLRRGSRVILISLFVTVTLAILYSIRAKPMYESTASVIIDTKVAQGTTQFLDLSGIVASAKITNELEVLRSNAMAQGVTESLLKKKFLTPRDKTIIPILLQGGEAGASGWCAPIYEIVERLMKSVDVTPVKESDIIKITARRGDPQEAALIANTYTEVYSDKNLSASRSKSKAIREFLQSLVTGKKSSLDSAENALKGYMRTSGIVSLDDETKKLVEQLSQLEATRDGIEVDIRTRTKTLDSYKQELALQEPNFAKSLGQGDDVYIRLLQDQLAKLETQRDMVIAQNPDATNREAIADMMSNLESQIATARKNLQARTKDYVKSLLPGDRQSASRDGTAGYLGELKQKIVEQQIELDGLHAKQSALNAVMTEYEGRFNQIPQKSLELAKLQRTRLSTEKLYLLVEEKFNEAAITETSDFGYVNVIDPAVVPLRPYSPNLLVNLALGLTLGLVTGIAIVVARKSFDTRIRTPEDLKRRDYVVLATIAARDEKKEALAKGQTLAGEKGNDVHLVAASSPLSPTTESYRHLLANIRFAQVDRPQRRILVTSVSRGEGKSTTVANLAIVAAQSGEKVLLIDADMRRPMLHALFNLRRSPGLVDLLGGKSQIDAVLQAEVFENLDIVCCGTIPPNPAGILGSREMQAFVDRMTKVYDVILFDSPPILAVTDAAVLGAKVDGVVVVVSAKSTKLPGLERATEFISGIGETLLGIVLNNFDARNVHGESTGIGYGYYGQSGGYFDKTG